MKRISTDYHDYEYPIRFRNLFNFNIFSGLFCRLFVVAFKPYSLKIFQILLSGNSTIEVLSAM